MSRLDELTDDHSRNPVPPGEGVSGIRVAMIIVGFAITLPLMITGSQMGLALGLGTALKAFVAGGLVLMVIGSLTAMVAADARLSTYKILEFSFGHAGARFVSALLALTLFGWYGVTAALFGDAYAGRCPASVAKVNATAFAAWCVAAVIGVGAARGWFGLSGIPACDAFLSAAVLYLLITRLWRRVGIVREKCS